MKKTAAPTQWSGSSLIPRASQVPGAAAPGWPGSPGHPPTDTVTELHMCVHTRGMVTPVHRRAGGHRPFPVGTGSLGSIWPMDERGGLVFPSPEGPGGGWGFGCHLMCVPCAVHTVCMLPPPNAPPPPSVTRLRPCMGPNHLPLSVRRDRIPLVPRLVHHGGGSDSSDCFVIPQGSYLNHIWPQLLFFPRRKKNPSQRKTLPLESEMFIPSPRERHPQTEREPSSVSPPPSPLRTLQTGLAKPLGQLSPR